MQHLPATLSSAILTGILRGKMGFQGVIISDDLGMAAVSETMPWEEVPVQALRAGVDLLLICHQRERQEQAYARVLGAVQRGELAESLVDRAVARIHTLKSRLHRLLRASRILRPWHVSAVLSTWRWRQALWRRPLPRR